MTPRRNHYSKREKEMVTDNGVPYDPPRPSDIEGRPSVGEDPLLDALIREHEERDPAKVKLTRDE